MNPVHLPSAQCVARRLGAALFAAALLLSRAAAAQTDADAPAKPIDVAPKLQSILESRRLPALAAVAVRDGQVAAIGAVGVRRAGLDEPVTTDDLWHIGSCTKAMTAALAARLVEADKIEWDTTIGASLGSIEGVGEEILPAWRGVTLRQLLSHRSGLPEDRQPDPAIWPTVRSLNGPIIEQRRAVARLILSRPPASEPGSEMAYSNFGYVIAGAMMEHATGRSWEELMRSEVFEPLEMRSAGFGAPQSEKISHDETSQPWGHAGAGATLKPVAPWTAGADNPAALGPAGTVHLSLADWAKFAAASASGGAGEASTYLKPESWSILHDDFYQQDYALGWVTGERPWAGGSILTHAGSNGLWFAVIWIAPARHAAAIAVTNVANEHAAPACDEAIVEALRVMELIP